MSRLNRREFIASGFAAATFAALPARALAQNTEPALYETARRELERLGNRIWLRDKVGIADFSRPSNEPRFFLLDMMGGTVHPYLVTHGRGSDPEHDGWLHHFSNEVGSAATSRGAYITHTWYAGKHGISMRLSGLDGDNSNAEDRAIVIHTAPYASPETITAFGKLGRSDGCFVFSEDKLPEILARLGPGRLLFADRIGTA